MMQGVLVGELLAMTRGLYREPLGLDEAIDIAQLRGLERRRVDRLSGGQSQRLRLAMALIGDPQLLVLDEPTAAMDVETRRSFWHAMEGFTARGRTILFSTHYIEEADVAADRIVMMARGRVVADGTPAAIEDSVGLRVIRFSITCIHHRAGRTARRGVGHRARQSRRVALPRQRRGVARAPRLPPGRS